MRKGRKKKRKKNPAVFENNAPSAPPNKTDGHGRGSLKVDE
jgi:hypothetical protein